MRCTRTPAADWSEKRRMSLPDSEKAEILSQPRHLVCRDRLRHLLLQGWIALHPREEVSELLERHRRLPAGLNLTAARGKSAFAGSWQNQR